VKARIIALLALALVVACGGGGIPRPEVPTEAVAFGLSERTLEAFRAEANDDTTAAIRRYLDLLDEARLGDSPWHLAAARAAIDALVTHEVSSLRAVTTRTALAFRAPRTGKSAPEPEIEHSLQTMHASASSAVVKGELARALVVLAERRGDWAAAERYRAARGCARRLTVIGPVDWTSLSALQSPSPLDSWQRFEQSGRLFVPSCRAKSCHRKAASLLARPEV
jgi:hypothetical protein